jgi:rubredoxin
MWLLFHRNVKTRVIRDGRSFLETCPACGRKTRFDEVEVSESYGVFFVDLVGDKERKYRCSGCGDVFDLRDEPDPPDPPPAKSAQELARERAAAEARRAAQAEQRRTQAEARANRIEDELADLKKRLGR